MSNKQVRFAVIGLGGRGYGMLRDAILTFDDADVTAVSDFYPDRCQRAANTVKEKRAHAPFVTDDYKEILKRDDVDVVYVATYWETHIEIAIEAMKAGKTVGIEVGGAYSVDELYKLIEAYEQTKTPFMFMENCCFGEHELLATSLARAGKFGTVVHCKGAYAHDLRSEVARGNINRHYRLRNYKGRNCENYPTHELGPIAKLLDINRGNRMLSLVSVASKSAGIQRYIKDNKLCEEDETLRDAEFKQGDIVNTVITCAGGETILLTLDTSLPRYYNRDFTVRGTKGMYEQATNAVFFDGDDEIWSTVEHYGKTLDNAKKYAGEYLPPEWTDITDETRQKGHGGMDNLLIRRFMDCFLSGEEMPIDVYDAASWMVITALSEKSIQEGGAPQAIPDFTNGKWTLRPRKDVLKLPY